MTAPQPPMDWPEPLQALWWVQQGGLALGSGWDRAHGLAQSREGTPDYDRVHAFLHRIEGDLTNAGYWYRRAGEPIKTGSFEQEWRGLIARYPQARDYPW